MEEKYDPPKILGHVWGKFYSCPGHEDSEPHEYEVIIEIKNKDNKCYRIAAKKNKPASLYKGIWTREYWSEIQDHEILAKDKNLLGKVHLRFKMNLLKIEGKTFGPFSNYDKFWEYISK